MRPRASQAWTIPPRDDAALYRKYVSWNSSSELRAGWNTSSELSVSPASEHHLRFALAGYPREIAIGIHSNGKNLCQIVEMYRFRGGTDDC